MARSLRTLCKFWDPNLDSHQFGECKYSVKIEPAGDGNRHIPRAPMESSSFSETLS